MDGLLLHCVDLQGVQLLVEDLAQVHHHTLMYLLPQMSPEDLDQGDLEGGDLAVHEDAGQVQLHLESHVHVSPVDGGRPPQSEPSVGDLVQTRALGMRQFLVLHGLLKAAGLLPEEPLPRGKVCTLKQRVLQDSFHTTEGLDHVRPVVVEVP